MKNFEKSSFFTKSNLILGFSGYRKKNRQCYFDCSLWNEDFSKIYDFFNSFDSEVHNIIHTLPLPLTVPIYFSYFNPKKVCLGAQYSSN